MRVSPRVVRRACRSGKCPYCNGTIRFTSIRLHNWPEPFLYCDTCSNILRRESDTTAAHQALSVGTPEPSHEVIMRLYHSIESSRPLCPCGGRFRVWANPRCPSCYRQLPYNNGVKNDEVRAHDTLMIVLDGATVIGDTRETTWEFWCQSD